VIALSRKSPKPSQIRTSVITVANGGGNLFCGHLVHATKRCALDLFRRANANEGGLMSTAKKRPPRPPALLSMRQACRRAGIAYATAMKLSVRGEFPPVRRLGHRRYVSRERFENWLGGFL
jgi:hypothetical protein